MKSKKGVSITIGVLIAIIIVVIMTFFIGNFFFSFLFGGPAEKAAKSIADQINSVCRSKDAINFNEFLPDSVGNNILNIKYFFIVIDNSNKELRLLARPYREGEPQDLKEKFFDFLAIRPDEEEILTRNLDDCEGIDICRQTRTGETKCGKFQFESNEGFESLSFSMSYVEINETEQIIISYERKAICGDKRCCGEEAISSSPLYCPQDCVEGSTCQVYTEL